MPTPIVPIFDVPDYEAEILRGTPNAFIVGESSSCPPRPSTGAAGLLNHPAATARLRALRNGNDTKPFTIHLAGRDDALQYLGTVSELGQRLMKKLWPGPIGLTFDVPADRRAQVAASLKIPEAEIYHDGSITLRYPDHMVTTDILREVPGPVVLTMASADAGGPNLKIESLAKELEGKVDLIFDTGPTRHTPSLRHY